MELRLVKLVTGEEFVAELVSHKTPTGIFIFKNATRLAQTPDGIAALPYPMLRRDKTNLEIDQSNVVFICELAEEVEAGLKAQFGGIITPKSSLIGV